jgi:poly(A) polymerase
MKHVSVLNNAESQPTIYSRDQHNISRDNIDEDALKIMYRLIRNGYKAFLVGGGVRDLLLSKKPKDFDIGTDATPRRIKSLFRNSRIIGRRFKLVHVYFRGNKNIEVSTFRDETEAIDENDTSLRTDNVYGHEATDALRRDLTINGLFYDLANFSVIDYVGGMPDLQAGIIRVIGDPDTRFRDDSVRLLRVIRHAARNDFKINKECWESLVKNKELIVKSSAVRVYEELKKDFTSGHFLEILKLLSRSGLLDYLMPAISDKEKELLSPNSDFHSVIRKIDIMVQRNQVISATSVLTVIALVLLNHDDNTVLPERNSEEIIKEFVRNVFISLSVPRKEKERIVSIISILHELSFRDLKKVKLSALSRKPYFKDLLQVAKVVEDILLTPEIMDVLQAAVANMQREKTDGDQHRQSRYFNRARRPK